MPTKKDVFISYKSEDYAEANKLKKDLEKEGISCWMAPESIPGGSSYAKEIPRAIRESRFFVLVFTGRTQNSKWIPRELDQAINNDIRILPFFMEDCTLEEDFSFYLSNVQMYTAFKNRNKAFRDMVETIKAEIGTNLQALVTQDGGDLVAPSISSGNEKVPSETGTVSSGNEKEPSGGRKAPSEIHKWIRPAAKGAVVILLAVLLFSLIRQGTEKQSSGADAGGNQASVSNTGTTASQQTVYEEPKPSPTDHTRVQIKDPALLKDICSELNISEDELTPELASSVRKLDFTLKDGNGLEAVSELDGISAFSNLEELYIPHHNISDISELADMKSLRILNLEENKIKNLTPLKGLDELEWIDLNDNRNIDSIEPLIALTKVEMLDLRMNHISDISGISGMVSLRKLYLSRNQIEDISPVVGLRNLTYLSFDGNSVSDISCLGSLTGLHTLTMNSNRITDISALSSLQELKHLEIAGNDDISDYSPLDQLPASCEIETSNVSKNKDS